MGRPRKVTDENREQLKQLKALQREEYLQRIPIEGKFGRGKSGYRLNYIRAKRADTLLAWISSIFLVMNLLILLMILFALVKMCVPAMGVYGGLTFLCRLHEAWWKTHRRHLGVRNRALNI